MKKLMETARKDSWLIAVLIICVLCCLLLKSIAPSGNAATTQEARIARVLSAIEGAGQVEVAIFFSQDDTSLPCGAVIVADGAKDIGVQLRLNRAAMTLLGLKAEQIEIFQRKAE